jgi:hypothetical protein
MFNMILATFDSHAEPSIDEFWTHFTNTDIATKDTSQPSTVPPRNFCDYVRTTRELIQVQREMRIPVMVHKFLHSSHVQHLRMYSEEYTGAIDKMLASIDKGSNQ